MSSEGVKNKSPDKCKRKRNFPDGDLSGIRVTKKLFPTQVSVAASRDELNSVALSTVSAMEATRFLSVSSPFSPPKRAHPGTQADSQAIPNTRKLLQSQVSVAPSSDELNKATLSTVLAAEAIGFVSESSPLLPPKRAHLGAQVDSQAISDTKKLLPSQILAAASSDELNESLSTELATEAIRFLSESSPLSSPKRAHLDALADSQANLDTKKLLWSQVLAPASSDELNEALLTESAMETTRFLLKTSPLSPLKRAHIGALANSQASSGTKMFLSESSSLLLSKRVHFSALGDSPASLGTNKLFPSQILAATSSNELNEAVSVVSALESSTLSLPNLPEGACFGTRADSQASSNSVGSTLVDCVVCSEPPSGLKISMVGHTDMHCELEWVEGEYCYHQGERSDCEASEVTACQDETNGVKLVQLLRFEERAGSEECTTASSNVSKHKKESHQWPQKWGEKEKLKCANESIREVQESEVVGISQVEGRRNLDRVMTEFDSHNCEISDESGGQEEKEEDEEERGMVGSLNVPGDFSFTVDTLDETNDEAQKTKPSYVLSSGRLSLEEESSLGTRPPSIDRDFEEYFSSLML